MTHGPLDYVIRTYYVPSMDATLDSTDPDTLVAALVANTADFCAGTIPHAEFEVRNAVLWRRIEAAGAVVCTRVRDLLRARLAQ